MAESVPNTHIMVLETILITSMNAQLGTMPNANSTYPNAFRTPYCAKGPSKGWNIPSCSIPSSYFFPVCNATISPAVVVVMFT